MSMTPITPLGRTLAALSHEEADRVPVFLGLTMHGAVLSGESIERYYADPKLVADCQLRMRDRYGHDNLMGFLHAAAEVEVWGGQVRYFEDGPPNAGQPIIQDPLEILNLEPGRYQDSRSLCDTLELLQLLKAAAGDEVPILAAVVSPFSLPVMQMGFGPYLDLLADSPPLFRRLMEKNEEYCVSWANAQLAAGATAIVYFDPVSSPTVIPPAQYRETGFRVALRTLPRIAGPTVTHFASGRTLAIADEVARTGTAGIGVSVDDDLGALKERCAGKLCLVGNLNGVAMRTWNSGQAEEEVARVINAAGEGGGLILSDNHGEIPVQVPEEVLHAVVSAAKELGRYPLAPLPADA